jgi:pimeloyl-ACP methyl ester carboxylesterase
MTKHHVLLVPGFFGFANLGDLAYFGHVRTLLAELLADLGADATVTSVKTLPTASIRRRATRVAEVIADLLKQADGDVHVIGHSSGGLDARMLVTPNLALECSFDFAAVVQKIRTVVTVATPHYGAPIAGIFTSVLGEHILRLFSLSTVYAVRTGRVPLKVVIQLVRFFARPSIGKRLDTNMLDQLYRELLEDFSLDRRVAIREFFESVGADRDLLAQITPAAMDVFNATIVDRPGVRYGSVITCAQRPGLRSLTNAGFDGYAQATHGLYAALHRLAGLPDDRPRSIDTNFVDRYRRAFGRVPDRKDNDGIVPTLSQAWGELIHLAAADHLDVIGHFDHPLHIPPHFDWITSGTNFRRRDFESVWSYVARFITLAKT